MTTEEAVGAVAYGCAQIGMQTAPARVTGFDVTSFDGHHLVWVRTGGGATPAHYRFLYKRVDDVLSAETLHRLDVLGLVTVSWFDIPGNVRDIAATAAMAAGL